MNLEAGKILGLRIEELSSTLCVPGAGPSGDKAAVSLPLGWRALSGWVWPALPRAAQVEEGIQWVEDSLEPLAASIRSAGPWAALALDEASFDALVQAVAPVRRDATRPSSVERSEVEDAFRLTADAAEGSVLARGRRQAVTPRADVVLLLVREITHHWDIARVAARDFPPGGAVLSRTAGC